MAEIEFDCVADGPILVKKDNKVEYALCRCGHSTKKPFCSGAHHTVGFKAEATKLEFKS